MKEMNLEKSNEWTLEIKPKANLLVYRMPLIISAGPNNIIKINIIVVPTAAPCIKLGSK